MAALYSNPLVSVAMLLGMLHQGLDFELGSGQRFVSECIGTVSTTERFECNVADDQTLKTRRLDGNTTTCPVTPHHMAFSLKSLEDLRI